MMKSEDYLQEVGKTITPAECSAVLAWLPAPACLLYDDRDSTVLEANPLFYQLIGCTEKELRYRFGNRFSALLLGGAVRLTGMAPGERRTAEHHVGQSGLRELWLRTEAVCLNQPGQQVICCVFSDITGEKQMEYALQDYRFTSLRVSSLTSAEAFQYHLQTRRANIYGGAPILSQITEDDQTRYGGFLAAILAKGIVLPGYTAQFEEAFAALNRGESSVTELKVRTVFGREIWVRMVLEAKQNQVRGTSQAIGVLQDITEQREASFHYLDETQFYRILLAEKEAYAQIDATQNQMLAAGGKWYSYNELIKDVSYSRLLEDYVADLVHPEDRKYYLELMQPDNFIHALENGVHRLSCQLRRIMEKNRMVWVEVEIRLCRHPYSGHVEALVYLRNIDERKRKELDKLSKSAESQNGLSEPSKAVPVGEAANTPTADFAQLLNQEGDIAYLVDVNTLELLQGNAAFYSRIGMTPGQCAGKTCYELMQGRQTPCPFCSRANWSRERFYVWRHWNEMLQQEFLVKNKLVQWKNREVLLAIPVDASNDTGLLDFMNSDASESHRVLSGVQRMMAARDIRESMSLALEAVGQFYHADAVQLWECSENGREYDCTYEWKRSVDFLRDPTDKSVRDTLNRWLGKRKWTKSLLIENLESMLGESFEMYELLRQAGIWNERWESLWDGKRLMGLLALVNLTENLRNNTFMETFGDFLVGEWKNRKLVEDMLYANSHDELTGLLSRTSYEQYLRQFLPDRITCVGVLVANLNDLKGINDRQGFQAGDYYIKQFATRLQEGFSDGSVFRLNGDEFLAIVQGLSWQDLTDRTDRLLLELREDGQYSVSVGCSWDNADKDLRLLIEQATQTMMINKKRYYDTVQNAADQNRYQMLQGLIESIARGQFEVYLQPKVMLATGQLIGAEALIRGRGDDGEVVPPVKFISQLERHNFIRYIDLFVFEEVCRLLERWVSLGANCPVVSLNFSRQTLLERDILTSVEGIFQQYRAPKNRVEIEITESMTEMGKGVLYQAAHSLYKEGYSISLDDFGTKYTNFGILTELEFDMLKLDMSLISSLSKGQNNQVILKNVISMCRDLNISVIAEGVETKEQEQILLSLGCPFGQGYLYGRPMPISEFEMQFLPQLAR